MDRLRFSPHAVPFGTLKAAMVLGLLWSAWHLPVIDFLGAATPHGHYLIPFFFSFATAMTAVRILMGWAYTNTKSVFLAQLLHISSTAALVIFSPPQVTPRHETFWYFVYGAVLWILLAIVGLAPRLAGRPAVPQVSGNRSAALK